LRDEKEMRRGQKGATKRISSKHNLREDREKYKNQN
jgi:hypothetical protein